MRRNDHQALTDEENTELQRAVDYAVYRQFGDLPHAQRSAGTKNVLKMHIEQLLTKRINDVLSGIHSEA